MSRRRSPHVKFTIADRFASIGQRLRADESIVRATLVLGYTANAVRHVEAARAAKRDDRRQRWAR